MTKKINLEYEVLLNFLINDGYLKTPLIIDAFRKIDRRDFVISTHYQEAYFNIPLPIGFGQTISQPLTVAFMLELLQPKPGEKILDIGAGSGWQTALLAYCVGKKGKVVGIELIPELGEEAKKNIAKYNFIKKGVVDVIVADGSQKIAGYPIFDKIIAAAAVEKEIPLVWKEELAVGGRIVAPVAQSIVVIDKILPDKFETKEFFGFNFVPLIETSGNN